MITESNLRELLTCLGYLDADDVFEKKYPEFHTSMVVDFNKRKLIYPAEIKGRNRNDGFDKNENFVVFECVNRLLEKGYRPENIELEKEWHLGHDTKSGRADVCITDETGSMLLIIECKKWGKEFDKALKDTSTLQLLRYLGS